MRGRAISSVKKQTESMNKEKLKELVRKSLMQEADIEEGIHDKDITSAPHTNVKTPKGGDYNPEKRAASFISIIQYFQRREIWMLHYS